MIKKIIKDIISGILIGIANVIPGVSGGSIALSLGIYDKLIMSVNSLLSIYFFREKEKILYLFRIGIGLLLGVFVFAKILLIFLNNYYVYTIFFFIGLIIASIPSVLKEIDNRKKIINYLFLLSGILLIIFISFLNPQKASHEFDLLFYIKLFFMGIIGASSMVLPGISGSFVLLVLGFYKTVMSALTFTYIPYADNLRIIFVFGVGVLIGIVFIVKIISILIKRFKDFIMFFVLGLVLGSIYIIFPAITETGLLNIFLYIFSAFFGFILVILTSRI